MEDEQWTDIRGFERMYRVSNLGAVASLPVPKGEGMRARRGRVLRQWCGKGGQPVVDLMVYGERSRFLVSRLVADAFLRPIRNGECVFHVDLNKANNRASNLRIMSYGDVCVETRAALCDFEMVPRDEMTANIARRYLEYREGRLFWRLKPSFSIDVGSEAGHSNDGAWKVHFCGETYSRNQIVYLLHTGESPDYVLPRNGDALDSRIENLFAATASQWATISRRADNFE